MRRIGATVGVAALTLVLALGLTEIVLRVFRLAPHDGVFSVSASQFEELPGIFSPGRDVLDLRNRALPHHASINSLGFRGAEFPREQPVDELRILFVGDSFVYGDFVDDDETIPAALERELARTCRAVRVVNAGLPGSTIIESAAMTERGLAVASDVVVIGFTENDVSDLRAEPLWELLARNRAAKSRFPARYTYPILRRTALWHLTLRVRGTLRAGRHAGPALATVDDGRGTPEATPMPATLTDPLLRARYEKEFSSLALRLRTRGIPAVLVTFPAHLTLYGRWTTEQLEWVHSLARREGILDVSTLDVLRATGGTERELYLLPQDGHPSARGYGVAARELARRLHELPVLRERCTG